MDTLKLLEKNNVQSPVSSKRTKKRSSVIIDGPQPLISMLE
jgi:hypothetical protein